MNADYELRPSGRSCSSGNPARQSGSSGIRLRLLIAAAILLFSVIGYLANADVNPVTGERQRVSISPEQEAALGLQAMPQMVRQHGGFSANLLATRQVQEMGARLLEVLERKLAAEQRRIPYRFEFHLLEDPRTINAFALPGGQVFITEALFRSLTNEGQLAGILGHEIGHVLERHGAEHLSQNQLLQGVASAAGIAGGDLNSARMAQMIAGLVSMKYGRGDELESDRWGVELMTLAGYDPEHMIEVMDILERAGGAAPPEILSTHPSPANRREYINKIIAEKFPYGKPEGLQ
ncbi:MAG: M48 family metalloprotease [Planctomycetota bacterium]